MTDRAIARHRAPSRPSTPLSGIGTTLTTAMSEHVGAIGRGGAVVAVSSGLVASLGLPASAAPGALDAGPATASLPAVPVGAATVVDAGSLFTARAELLAGAPVTAPATATLQFEKSAFTAVPTKVRPKKVVKAEDAADRARDDDDRAQARRPAARDAARASRSATRAVKEKAEPAKSPSVKGGSFGSARGSSVLAIAARYYGIPYRYGGTTPRGFDCSGFTGYVFAQVGVKLPRTSGQQLAATRRVPRSQARPGDLVFTLTGGRVSHVGIYAGDGMMVHSPRTGKSVTKSKIWSANIVFGRV